MVNKTLYRESFEDITDPYDTYKFPREGMNATKKGSWSTILCRVGVL